MGRHDCEQRLRSTARTDTDVSLEPIIETTKRLSDLLGNLLGVGGAPHGLRI